MGRIGASLSEFLMVNLRVRMKLKYLKSILMQFPRKLENIFNIGDEIEYSNGRKK